MCATCKFKSTTLNKKFCDYRGCDAFNWMPLTVQSQIIPNVCVVKIKKSNLKSLIKFKWVTSLENGEEKAPYLSKTQNTSGGDRKTKKKKNP